MSKTVFQLGATQAYMDVTDDHIRELSQMCTVSDRVLNTAGDIYVRTLVARTQFLIASKGLNPLVALEQAELPMYEAVKLGALTEDVQYNPLVDTASVRTNKAKEHNRRCNWARSIKSELKTALKAGVNIGDLDMFSVTKKEIRDRKVEAKGGPKRRATTEAVGSGITLDHTTESVTGAALSIGFAIASVMKAIEEGKTEQLKELYPMALALEEKLRPYK